MDSSTTKIVAKNTIYQLVGKFVTMSVTILITIIITRVYGRQGYGEFNIMQAFPAFFFIIADFGLNAISVRELSKDWSKVSEYLSNVFAIRLILSILLMTTAVYVLKAFPYTSVLKFGVYLSLPLVLTQSLFATTNIIFQAKMRYDLSSVGVVVGGLVILILAFLLSLKEYSVVWINFSYVAGGIVTFFINAFFIRRFGIKLGFTFNLGLWKYLFLQSIPLGMMFVFSQINFKADSILISVLKLPSTYGFNNTQSVAIYSLPYKVFEVALVAPTFFMNAAYPVFVNSLNESKSKLKKTFFRVMGILVLLGLAISAGGVIAAPAIIKILGGTQFTQSINVLRLLFAGIFIFFITQPISWLIVAIGEQKYLPAIYLISAVFNVSLNLYFIPRYSFYSSAVITWLSESLILVLLVVTALYLWKRRSA